MTHVRQISLEELSQNDKTDQKTILSETIVKEREKMNPDNTETKEFTKTLVWDGDIIPRKTTPSHGFKQY